jgi:tRNA dimethylallyltransferase
MFRQLEIAIHQFAKRQMTWFREWKNAAQKFTGSTGICPWRKKLKWLLNY